MQKHLLLHGSAFVWNKRPNQGKDSAEGQLLLSSCSIPNYYWLYRKNWLEKHFMKFFLFQHFSIVFPFLIFLLFFLLVGLYPTTVNWMLGGEVANWSLRFLQTFLCPLTMLSIATVLSAVDLYKTRRSVWRQNSRETEKLFGKLSSQQKIARYS